MGKIDLVHPGEAKGQRQPPSSAVRAEFWGEADAVIPAAHAAALPGAQVSVIPDAGHMVQMEQSAEVNRLIRDFIA